ncbi:MAG: ribosomal protein S18-alanine N-acetyltransferase [Alkalibacterium sp.]|nr:ribosomal protein S18-alanine N-acetyltransferase [Alkalibacterium sp.]
MQEQRLSVRRYNFNEDQYDRFYDIADHSFSYGSPWTVDQYRETLKREDLVFFVAEIDTHLIGYIGGQLLLDEAEIYTVVVSREFQKQRVAQCLFDRFREECVLRGIESIFLEVRKSNEAAQSFYSKNAFEVITVRKNYYTYPAEDAIIMQSRIRKREENG